MSVRWIPSVLFLAVLLVAVPLAAQVDFERTGYYVAMGDSFVAGQGAIPMTRGYAYQLYDRGIFGKTTETFFANLGIKGARSYDVRDHQVPEVLCAQTSSRPTVVTITVGANDIMEGSGNTATTGRIAQAVDLLLNNATIVDPKSGAVCPALSDVTIMVSNYYDMPGLTTPLTRFSNALEAALATVTVPEGSRVVFVDLLTPSIGRTGLTLADRDPDGDIHPTNLGHSFIAAQFAQAWDELE